LSFSYKFFPSLPTALKFDRSKRIYEKKVREQSQLLNIPKKIRDDLQKLQKLDAPYKNIHLCDSDKIETNQKILSTPSDTDCKAVDEILNQIAMENASLKLLLKQI
jgi:hypothetical protein